MAGYSYLGMFFISIIGGATVRRLFFNADFSIKKYDNFIVRSLYRITGWTQYRGSLTVFLMSAALNPVFFPMALAIGASRFQLWRFFLMCWAGNTVKSMVIAYLGYFGLDSLLSLMGFDV